MVKAIWHNYDKLIRANTLKPISNPFRYKTSSSALNKKKAAPYRNRFLSIVAFNYLISNW